MQANCSICGNHAASRPIRARGGKVLTLWHCASCDFDFLAHDPTRDLAANKLDESRLKAAGLDIPTRERDFVNGLAQSRPYVAEYLGPSDRGANILEIGCSWGYFLRLAGEAGVETHLIITAQKKGAGRNTRNDILGIVHRHQGESGIVYCLSRKSVESTAEWLRTRGVRAAAYHAGLADDARARTQDAFARDEVDVVVATVAFGMGIDRSNVRFVVHVGAPRSLEHYQQESGRAGRDGLEAECLLIYSPADFMKWRVMLEQNGELTDAARALLRDMERFATSVGCRHRHLVEYFGDRYEKRECSACDVCLGELEPAEPKPDGPFTFEDVECCA